MHYNKLNTKFKMNAIKSIVIGNVDLSISAKQITDTLYEEKILSVSKITLYDNPNVVGFKTAVIEIGEWMDTEEAYQVIKSIHIGFYELETNLHSFIITKAETQTFNVKIFQCEEDEMCADYDRYLEWITYQEKLIRKEEEINWLEYYENESLHDDLLRSQDFMLSNGEDKFCVLPHYAYCDPV